MLPRHPRADELFPNEELPDLFAHEDHLSTNQHAVAAINATAKTATDVNIFSIISPYTSFANA